jgi:hypothetical protein
VVSFSQDEVVMVVFVPRFEIDQAFAVFHDFVQTHALTVMESGGLHVGDAKA